MPGPYPGEMNQSRGWATGWSVARLAMAALVIAAIVAQFVSTTTNATAEGRDIPTTVANFFSYFTILSNTASAAVLIAAGVWFLPRGRRIAPEPPVIAAALAWVTTYMVITGVVYNTLLRAISIGPDTVGWSNEVMHVWAPLFLLIDLFVGPNRRRLPWGAAVGAAAFPLAWIAYTLVRAPLITNPTNGLPYWYPYPFLDPNDGGWGSVIPYIVGIAVGIVVVAVGVVAVGRRRGIRVSPSPRARAA